MRTFGELWQAYMAEADPEWLYEVKCAINSQEYTQGTDLFTYSKTGGLIVDDFSLGNCPSIGFNVTVAEKSGVTVPKNAKVEPYVRIVGAEGNTPWYRLGAYFIDRRERLSGGKLLFECFDRMLYLDRPFLEDGEELDDYPMPMDEAMGRIYTALGTTLDARCTISHTMMIEYPNDMTMRQVAGMIASAHGGNFVITDEDYLRLVIPGYTGSPAAAVTDGTAKKIKQINNAVTYDTLTMIYGEDGAFFTNGPGTNELQITNYWATQAMVDAVQDAIDGYEYTPMEALSADIDPALELGDYITIGGVDCNLWTWAWNNRLYCDITLPSSRDDRTSEFGYTGTLTQALTKKVSLGTPYYGTTISRAAGLKIAKTDGSAEAQFNADVLAMRALQGGVMKDVLYFDPSEGTFMFAGKLTAEVIAALSAVITPNLYAEKATIAELTVDQLDTSTKVQKYLNEDTNDVNYIKISEQTAQWITASTDGLTTEQAENRSGQPLYWTDETHTASTTDETDYPVTIYVYTEYVKGEINFYDDGTNYVPRIVLGTGTGVDDNDKLILIKETSSATVEYTTAGGNRMAIEMSADGVQVKGNTGQYGLRNIAIRTEAPAEPETNDLWIDTDA